MYSALTKDRLNSDYSTFSEPCKHEIRMEFSAEKSPKVWWEQRPPLAFLSCFFKIFYHNPESFYKHFLKYRLSQKGFSKINIGFPSSKWLSNLMVCIQFSVNMPASNVKYDISKSNCQTCCITNMQVVSLFVKMWRVTDYTGEYLGQVLLTISGLVLQVLNLTMSTQYVNCYMQREMLIFFVL
jgi:hypothetical protein